MHREGRKRRIRMRRRGRCYLVVPLTVEQRALVFDFDAGLEGRVLDVLGIALARGAVDGAQPRFAAYAWRKAAGGERPGATTVIRAICSSSPGLLGGFRDLLLVEIAKVLQDARKRLHGVGGLPIEFWSGMGSAQFQVDALGGISKAFVERNVGNGLDLAIGKLGQDVVWPDHSAHGNHAIGVPGLLRRTAESDGDVLLAR